MDRKIYEIKLNGLYLKVDESEFRLLNNGELPPRLRIFCKGRVKSDGKSSFVTCCSHPPLKRLKEERDDGCDEKGHSLEEDLGDAFSDESEYLPLFEIDKDYRPLFDVLMAAYEQSSKGKGKERHSNDLPFLEQPIMRLAEAHGLGFLTGQAAKKLQEAHTLLTLKGTGAAMAELLGAIVYAAAAHIFIERLEAEADAN